MAAKVEPFRSWGLHMASFGAQATLTADSPYYKLLIGRVMGYEEANIIDHIQVCCACTVLCHCLDHVMRVLACE